MELSEKLLAFSIATLFPAAIFYCASALITNRRLTLIAHGLTLVSWLVLTAGLVLGIRNDALPALSTSGQPLIVISCALLAVHLVQVWKWDLPAFGAAVTPLALASLFAATALPANGSDFHQEFLASQWMRLHVLSIVVSMILLLLASCSAVLWLIQHHCLKAKKWAGAFRRLPPLEVLESMGYVLAAIGFAALTVGVVTVVVWAVTHPAQPQMQDILTRLAAVATWLVYAFYLWAHTRPRWRGRRAHYILVVGCLAILLTTAFHRWFLLELPVLHPNTSHPTSSGAPKA